ncbi:RIP metalloprotease RseP [bacterium 1xD42-62]|uniref:Zinc metalloprotease n=1 Tax=Parablautia muri TaxID=2320879 RepID=A0A9X5BIF6_9FIRM|nr:RIP metalloprotease RseP [Parablautia muri]NBJ93472.1 RIP metalloprotease RseP [Parablautia muri]
MPTGGIKVAVSIILFLVIFFVVVISHEFGHFILAKKNGIRVVEFFVGMGPSLFSFQKGDTKYSLKLFPIGGACMFEGEDGLAAEKGEMSEKAFPNAPVWARFATIFAGPLFNFLLAYLMALILVSVCGITTSEVQAVNEGSKAEEAGLRAGDVLTKMNGKRIHLGGEVTLISQLNTKGESLTVTYRRDGQENTVVIDPAYDETTGRYYMGIVAGGYLKCNVPQTFQYAFYTMKFYAEATIQSLKMLVTGQLSRDDVSGPVGLVKVVDEVYDSAKAYGAIEVLLNMINIALLLSVNLGIMNLLPLPALDGGRLVFLLVEAIRGKPIPPEKEGMVHLAGMVALMLLMVLVFFNDITKFF